jgi:hypothetical protein
MARTLESFPPSPTQARRYPWGEYMDGQVWLLIHGEDFTAKPSTFRTMATQQATRRGGRVRIRTVKEGDREGLALQFQRVVSR